MSTAMETLYMKHIWNFF